MPEGYQQIPDWFSFENEGGGIAVASISGASTQDLLIAAVDSPEGQNRGVYRIGRKVDGDGQVTGGWSPWRDVPDWFSHNNAGVAAVVADIDGDSKPDLVLFMIDAPTEQNQGYYRIGKALDSDGNLTGGWGPWIPIPDWFSWENQHGAIAVADLDGDGRLELIVLMVDNPPGKNRGVYRIGRALDAGGQVTGGWTPWIDVPDWFSWENQGAGITVIDRGMAAKDLVVLMVDNPVGQNQAFYKIGKDVNIDGTPVGGWSEWLGVPAWFSWENQGAGIAVMPSNGTPAMSVMLVDNPPGQNEGRYRVLPLDVNPERDGEWELLQYDSQVLAVHAALLPTGSVLFFAGSGSSKARFESPEFPHLPTSVVWDPNAPAGSNFSTPPILLSADGRPYDYFCGGDTFLSDGKLLSAGGTATYPFSGRREAATFDPKTKQWGFVAQMDRGRWYPTLLTLGDGRVLAASDLEEKNTLEIYSPKTNTWTTSTFAPGFAGLPLYAHLFLMANGKICFTGGRMDDLMEVAPCIFDLAHNPVSTVQIPNGTQGGMRNQSASVLLPPAQDQRVMIMGGGPPFKANKTDAIDNVDIVDLSAVKPHFVPASPLSLPRLHLNAVLLPDRTVFVTGGSLKQEEEGVARLQSEIYDPATDTWTLTAPAAVPRLYHSTALLLPDGRVVTAGSNPEEGEEVEFGKDPREEMRLEIYKPPYLFKGSRPKIKGEALNTEWSYGTTQDIPMAQAGPLRWAHLMKNGVTTHSFDSSQRLVDLPIVSQGNGRVRVRVTDNPNIAPPGWYMLFVVNQERIPSIGHWIHLT